MTTGPTISGTNAAAHTICAMAVAEERQRIARLEAENASLREALVKYGAHTGMCGYGGAHPGDGYVCVCGLYDLVDQGEFERALRSSGGREGEV